MRTRARLAVLFVLVMSTSAIARGADEVAQSGIASLDGIGIHYQTAGVGDRGIVFVHGWGCNGDFWKRSSGEFGEYRVIVVDLPGHGRSDKPHVDYSMELFARGVNAVMEQAGVSEAVLVGHSMGTPVIRQFYRLYPGKTLGLVIVDGSLRIGSKEEIDQLMDSFRTDYQKTATSLVDGLVRPIHDESLKQEIRTAMLATPEYVGVSSLEGMVDEGIWSQDKINVPVLAILAESPAWEPDTEAFYRSIAPDIDFQMWHGVSHFLMMERPKDFNETLKQFIAKRNLLEPTP